MMEKFIQLINKIPVDKVQHFAGGALIFSACSAAGLALAGGAVLTAAAGKEVYDYLHRESHTCSLADFLATVVGGAVVAFSVFISGGMSCYM